MSNWNLEEIVYLIMGLPETSTVDYDGHKDSDLNNKDLV
jgi:hypothetical protein